MSTYCVCGRKIESSSAHPWACVSYDGQGNFISGTCVHGVRFGEDANGCFEKDSEKRKDLQ
jgi:hypothetical protein